MRVNPPGNAGGYGQGPQAERSERADKDGKRRQPGGGGGQEQRPKAEEHDQVELHGSDGGPEPGKAQVAAPAQIPGAARSGGPVGPRKDPSLTLRPKDRGSPDQGSLDLSA